MSSSWKQLEDYVRTLAQVIWGCPFQPERIGGVNFDATAKISEEEKVLIEVTEEFDLDKIRSDVSKIGAIKLKMAADMVVAKSFIVLSKNPTPGMIDIGAEHKIKVCSVETFASFAFDYRSYSELRLAKTFGSSIDPITGLSDNNTYIPVTYLTDNQTKTVDIDAICASLYRRNTIVLLGDYGTGKSRCIREVFNKAHRDYRNASAYPLAINLREHWGSQSGVEIVAGHFKRLGLSSSVDIAMKLLGAGRILLLLDGFDEVGAQTFGNTEEKRTAIRKNALGGVADLLELTRGGVLLTGRAHYFDDNEELLSALGLSLRSSNTSIIRCRSEFEEAQSNAYLKALGLNAVAPAWLPKKPLMFQIIASIEKNEAEKILNSHSGELGFWGQFIDTVCLREATMHPSIEASTVRSVLGNLARITRNSPLELGRLTPKDVQNAYELATGHIPDQSGDLMLSRLCTLGRIAPESPDRQFVDPYIVQLLFADCIVEDISNKNHDVLNVSYIQPLQPLGLYFLAQWIEAYDFEDEALSFMFRDPRAHNTQIVGELLSALLLIPGDEIDFDGLQVGGCIYCMLALGTRKVKNATLSNSFIDYVSLDDCKVDSQSNFTIKNTEIVHISGLTSVDATPNWFVNSKPKRTDTISNACRIKASSLKPSEKLFLSVIHKIFFQRGGGRKENSLYKGGFGQKYDPKIIDNILHKLVADGYVEKSRDSSGSIYNPKREYTSKMKAIRDQLALSNDPLWIDIGKMS
jgi:hypothetical protein